jgi:hypothetical protein
MPSADKFATGAKARKQKNNKTNDENIIASIFILCGLIKCCLHFDSLPKYAKFSVVKLFFHQIKGIFLLPKREVLQI